MSIAMRHRRGFTLIELLVVIAIIAILAAILFPVFAQAREKARAVSCLSNVKQLTTGMLMYVQDYDETFPYWNWVLSADVYCSGTPGCGRFESFWPNAIYSYVKNGGIYQCSSLKNNVTLANTKISGWTNKTIDQTGIIPALWDVKLSYGMSEALHFGELSAEASGPNSHAIALAELNKPAQTMSIADTFLFSAGSIYDGNGEWMRLPNAGDPTDPAHRCIIYRVAYAELENTPDVNGWNAMDPCDVTNPAWDAGTRHTGGSNIAFADGHSKFMRGAAINNDLHFGTQAQ